MADSNLQDEANEVFKQFGESLATQIEVLKASTGHNDLDEIRRENRERELQVISLERQLKLLTATHAYLKGLNEETAASTSPTKRLTRKRKREFDTLRGPYRYYLSLGLERDVEETTLRSVLGEVVKFIGESGVDDPIDITPEKKSRSSASSTSSASSASLSGSSTSSASSQVKRTPLTRSKLSAGAKEDLVNPIKYFDCLLCSRSEYDESTLRAHYWKNHKLNFGVAPLPTSREQIDNHQVDDQESTTCYICGHECDSIEELVKHKSKHVNPKFCRYADRL